MNLKLVLVATVCTPFLRVGFGCGTSSGGGGTGTGTGGGTDATTLRVGFNAGSGNFAVAEDDAGNEYTFRAREDDEGNTIITEANILTANGTTLKASLDSEGRPVNFRASDNTNADVVYDGDQARIRFSDSEGNVEDVDGLDSTAARVLVENRRTEAASKRLIRAQSTQSSDLAALLRGMENYEEIVEALFDATANPDSPLSNSNLREAALLLAKIATLFDIEEVDSDEVVDDITLDETPAELKSLAGHTFVLFDAQGFCIDQTGTANRITFDNNGILQSEFDRYFVFPDFSLGGSGDPGVTINYSTGTPVNLTPGGDIGFSLVLTPVFTGSQLDENGFITIERRFQADIDFEVDTPFGVTTAGAQQLFDAAFVNGSLSDDGNVLEFDILLIDLQEDNPVEVLGRARYYNQNSPAPTDREFGCEFHTVQDGEEERLICPASVAVSEEFVIEYIPGRDETADSLDYDWFVSDGYGFITSDSFTPHPTIIATGDGFLEVTLILSDLAEGPNVFEVHICQMVVGNVLDDFEHGDFFELDCPRGLAIGEPGFFSVRGDDFEDANPADLVEPAEHLPDVFENYPYFDWFVFGTGNFFITDPFSADTEITIYEPGKFEVAFRAFDDFGNELFSSCLVSVEGEVFDECAEFGFYGDGICDRFCFEPDPDCDEGQFYDVCAESGFYGDGFCDDFCPEPDPDCEHDQFDLCAELNYYGDGICDDWCIKLDPDCDDREYDICEANGFYGDGICDDFCLYPDYDCGEVFDECAELGYYGDGICDGFCLEPDPDCEMFDDCEAFGFYGDGVCDSFCLQPDPDCEFFDECAEYGFYGDGFCDYFCPEPDPDCSEELFDECAEFGYYNDGFCDEFCLDPDPDCADEIFDECAEFGYYNDGICDDFCLDPDPDCDSQNDPCGADGVCDDGCVQDPDCDAGQDDPCGADGICGDGCATDPDCV